MAIKKGPKKASFFNGGQRGVRRGPRSERRTDLRKQRTPGALATGRESHCTVSAENLADRWDAKQAGGQRGIAANMRKRIFAVLANARIARFARAQNRLSPILSSEERLAEGQRNGPVDHFERRTGSFTAPRPPPCFARFDDATPARNGDAKQGGGPRPTMMSTTSTR
jgi:hypothetical protein